LSCQLSLAIVNTKLVLLLLVELAFAQVISPGFCVIRKDYRNAFRAWKDNPTAETRGALGREKAVTNRMHVVQGFVIFAGLASVTLLARRIGVESRQKNLLREKR
jgi:hypothetical protein